MLTAFSMLRPASSASAQGVRVIYETESLYYSISVYDKGGVRYLRCDNQVQSGMDLKAPDSLFYEYVRSFFSALAFKEHAYYDSAEAVFVGLGAGSLPGYFMNKFPDARLDIIELDPEVARIAGEYFDFSPSANTALAIEDARVFLARSSKKYDLIMLDPFYGATIPFHLTTREFLELLRGRLKPGGMVVGHYWGPQHNEYFDAQLRTFQEVFREVRMLDNGLNSIILVAMAEDTRVEPEELYRSARAFMKARDVDFDMEALLKKELRLNTPKNLEADVLTDDYAPVNIMRERVKGR